MAQVRFRTIPIPAARLSRFATDLLATHSVAREQAAVVADTLVQSNLRGVDSHGIARLPHYLRRLTKGSLNPQPQMQVARLGPAAARLDADHALGQLAMLRATDEAIELARASGAGWVAVRNSSHCGALAYYGLRIADAGMLGLVFTHVDPMVLPFGARAAFCGTNPVCIAAPRAKSGADQLSTGALCLDMATSKTSWNSVANAAQEHAPIPLGWAVDTVGRDTTTAEDVAALYPVGEYKGSGLGLMIDVLCAMLSGAPFGPDIPRMYGDLSERRQLGGLVGAIDISRFVPLETFHARIADLIARWNALPASEPGGRVQFPGEPELRERERRLQTGIPLGVQLLAELNAIAADAGVAPLEHERSAFDTATEPAGPHRPSIHVANRSGVSELQ